MPPTDRSALSPLEQRVGYYTDRVRSQMDDVYYNRGMQRLQQLVEAASATPESADFQTDIGGGMPTSPYAGPRAEMPQMPTGIDTGVGGLQARPVAPAPPAAKPKMPKALKSQFPAQEWAALNKRNPEIGFAASQQEMMDALDNGKKVLAIQAAQRMGLDPDKTLAIMSEHGARKVVEKLGPLIESAPDQETAWKLARRHLAPLSLSQQRTAELAVNPMIAQLKPNAVIRKERLGVEMSSFIEQHGELNEKAFTRAWHQYIKQVDPDLRKEFSDWAQGRADDLRANEREDLRLKNEQSKGIGAEERLYNSIASSVHKDVAYLTNSKFPNGTRISVQGTEVSLDTGGNPKAGPFYVATRRRVLEERLKRAGLWKQFESSVASLDEPAAINGEGELPPGIPAGATYGGATKEGFKVYLGPDLGPNGKPVRRAVTPGP